MEAIEIKFGTPQAAPFRERGCDEVFHARLHGIARISDYDRERYDDGEDLAPLRRAVSGAAGACLSRWPGDELLMRSGSKDALGDQLRAELAELGITAEVTVDSVNLTEESRQRYDAAFGKLLLDAALPKVCTDDLEETPHGPLRRFSYTYSSHGMMAGSSSWGGDTVCWNDDGSAVLSTNSHGGGTDAETEYRVKPEAAEALRTYVTVKRLAALSKINPPVMGYDSITTTSFSMTFDDRTLGGGASETVHVNCGMAGMYFRDVEAELHRLIEECRETGECIRSERKENAAPGLLGIMGMLQPQKPAADVPAPPEKPRGIRWSCPECAHAENYGKFCVNCGTKRPELPGAWTCPSCGFDGNDGRFCANCGTRRA